MFWLSLPFWQVLMVRLTGSEAVIKRAAESHRLASSAAIRSDSLLEKDLSVWHSFTEVVAVPKTILRQSQPCLPSPETTALRECICR